MPAAHPCPRAMSSTGAEVTTPHHRPRIASSCVPPTLTTFWSLTEAKTVGLFSVCESCGPVLRRNKVPVLSTNYVLSSPREERHHQARRENRRVGPRLCRQAQHQCL